MLERFSRIGEAALFLTQQGYLFYIVQTLFAFVLLYYVFKVLRDNGAKKFMGIYAGLIFGACALALFSEGIDIDLLLIFTMLLSMFFLLMYSLEIKRGLTKMKKVVSKSNFEAQNKTAQQTEGCISGIIKAVQNMSKKDTGALIVLANKNFPKQIVDSGIVLDADISSQLIEGIFINKAPLHDGAMIVDGHKIVAAGCFLPLTQNNDIAPEYGSRHRAAIGVTEACDVTTIVVSEETGIVSIVKKGQVERYADFMKLRRVLTEYYFAEDSSSGRSDKKNKERTI